jgi:hypothetical protein
MSKEKVLKAYLKSLRIQGRIDELKETRSYHNSQVIYRKRLTALEDQLEELNAIVNGEEEVETKKITVTVTGVDKHDFDNDRYPEKLIQLLKREKFVIS